MRWKFIACGVLLLQVVFATVGKTVYFIRHAESLWNEAKTKKRSFTEQTMDVLKKEYKDAPLTPKGLNQIRDLRNWFWKDDGSCWNHTLRCLYSSLSGELPNESSSSRDASATPSCERATPGSSWPSPHPSKVAYGVSNLHRAIETLLVFLGGRPRDDPSSPISVDIVSALQEISRNHDAETKLGRGEVPDIADGSYSAAIEGIGFPSGRSPLKYVFNGTFNEGELNTVFKEDKIARFNKCCDWVFDQTEKDTFVVSGHSFWLMYFFMASFGRAPKAASERGSGGSIWTKRDVINLAEKILRTKNLGHIESIKLGNASMIKFKLIKLDTEKSDEKMKCQVVANSTQLMYGSWQAKGKCLHDASCRGLVEDIGNAVAAASATVASSVSGEDGETCSVA